MKFVKGFILWSVYTTKLHTRHSSVSRAEILSKNILPEGPISGSAACPKSLGAPLAPTWKSALKRIIAIAIAIVTKDLPLCCGPG